MRQGEAGRCFLDNGNAPQEPAMTEAEKADTLGFLKEILQILPLVGLRAFEKPEPVSRPEATTAEQIAPRSGLKPDTIIVPAQKDGFEDVFLDKNEWYAIRISGGMINKIKFIAAYQSAPISAITHVAPVKQIEPYGETGKYKLVFSEPAQPIESIPYGDAPSGAMQGPRYTTIKKLRSAKTVGALLAK